MATVVAAAALVALGGCATPANTGRVNAEAAKTHAANKAIVAQDGLPGINPGVPGSAADADRRAAVQASRMVLARSSRAWVAAVPVAMRNSEERPTIFFEPVKFNFDDAPSGGRVGIRKIADRVTAVTGVPVRVKSDVFQGEGAAAAMNAGPVVLSSTTTLAKGGQAAAPASTTALPGFQQAPGAARGPLPGPDQALHSIVPGAGGADGQASTGPYMPPVPDTSVAAVAMKWSGTLEGFLNHVTDMLGLSWEYRDGGVVIERYRTEFFEVATLDSESSFAMTMAGADTSTAKNDNSGGGTTSSSTADVKEQGKSETLKSIVQGVEQIIRTVPGSSVVLSSGSGRLAVTTTKEGMSKVREFVRSENESMLRQAQIQFDIYSVRSNDVNDAGVDWQAVFQSLGYAVGGAVAAPTSLVGATAGNVSFNILSGIADNRTSQRWGGSQAIVKLLSELGTATQHRPVSLLSLNRQWARKASVSSKAYVSETTPGPASSTGVGAPGLKTATISTGDRYLALPYILDNSTVVLKFAVGISSLVDIVDFQSGQGQTLQRVQTPETSAVLDQSTVALKAGQMLAITGLSRIITSDRTRTLGENVPVAFGGSRAASRQREDFLIIVRPTIL